MCLECASIPYLPLATSHGNIDETAGVCYPLLGPALRSLLLLLLLDLCHHQVSTPLVAKPISSVTSVLAETSLALPATDTFGTATNISFSYLWRLRLDLSGTSEGSVNFTHGCGLSGSIVWMRESEEAFCWGGESGQFNNLRASGEGSDGLVYRRNVWLSGEITYVLDTELRWVLWDAGCCRRR